MYSFSSPIRLVRATGSQCTVTWVLSMSDTRRFRGAVLGPRDRGNDDAVPLLCIC